MSKLTWNDYMKEDILHIYDVELPVNKNNVAELALIGDEHFGNPVYDESKLPMKIAKSQRDYVEKNEHIKIMSMGDELELISKRSLKHIRNSGREMLMAEEANMYCDVWGELFYKMVGKVTGNHELRITRETDRMGLTGFPIIDAELIKANKNCVIAEPERGILLRVKVGDESYMGYFLHGTGSSTRPDYYLKKVFNVFEGIDFCAMAHIHQTFNQNYPILDLGKRYKSPRRKSRIGIRTGTPTPYLSYAENKLYPISEPSNMIVSFDADRKKIRVDRLMQDRIL